MLDTVANTRLGTDKDTSNGYSADGNLLTSVTDANGSTVTYTYGDANSRMLGLPTAVTAPNGTVTNTVYDIYSRVTQTSVANLATLLYTYDDGYLSAITRRDSTGKEQVYTLTSDDFGKTTAIRVGDRLLASYAYEQNNGPLTMQTYGNGETVSYEYDHLGRVSKTVYSSGLVLSYAYTGEGYLHSVTETKGSDSTRYIYTYDTNGRVIGSERLNGGESVLRTRQSYDSVNRLEGQIWQIGEDTYSESYTYNSTIDGSLNTMTVKRGNDTIATFTMGYDGLRRLSSVTGGVYSKSYTYRDISNTQTTSQISSLTYDLPVDQTFAYTYDSLGNIATYTAPNGEVITYTYDGQGQLLSAVGDQTYSYTYDSVGNILTGNGHTYTYGDTQGWADLLTAVDGENITYDAIGNPTSYYNGTRWNFTWERGRNLAAASGNGKNVTYTYDGDGLRTGKVVNGDEYVYYYAGEQLVRMTMEENGTLRTLDFYYDTSGPYAVKVTNGSAYTTYYYVKNLQGDIVAIVNRSGTVLVTYTYDAWGNILSIDGEYKNGLGVRNPLRYRGYVYDTETSLYYLQSRYYDPELGRFINADAYASTGQGILGNNMFAYCGNNPVLRLDPAGYSWWGDFWEWVKDSTEEQKEKASDNGNGTGTTGITTSAAFGIGGSVSLGITFDEKGNIGIAGTFNAGGGFPSAGIGGFVTVTNAPDIYKQNGLGTVVGASGGPGVIAVGGEFSIMADTENCETYYGGTISATAGLYPTFIEIHGEVGYTSVVGFNVFDAVMAIADAMLWIEEGIRP